MGDTTAEHGAEDFFRQQRAAFAHTLATQGTEATLLQAWGAYELHHTLVLALDRPDAQAAWARGEYPLAEAAADVEQREAMAAGFDEMRH